jgi:hypothetical protein
MVLPVMQRVHDKVNFTLSFIGTYVELTPPFKDLPLAEGRGKPLSLTPAQTDRKRRRRLQTWTGRM